MEQKLESMREVFGQTMTKLGESNKNLVVVGADTSESIASALFGKKFPDRFFNVGIAEQNMIGVSAGLAMFGKRVFCGTYAVFLERAIDQIRNTIAYCNLDVKIIGAHAGLSVGPDGGSHQTIEDISIMRALPNLSVVAPADSYSAGEMAKEVANTKGPFYIRLIRPNVPNIYTNETVKVGKANILREGSDIGIVACGLLVHEALKAAEKLQREGISARVIDCHTIKPIDEDIIIKAAKDTGRIITAEDHNVMGGLGSAVAEVLSRKHPTMMSMIGVNDAFGESGDPAQLMAKYGISENNILEKARTMVKQ